MSAIFDVFVGAESTIALAARYMADHNLTPQDVLTAYDAWLARMSPAAAKAQPRRSRAGDRVQLARACPKCGGTVEMLQLCPQSSPHWRTQMACMVDGCDWHDLSTLPLDALLAADGRRGERAGP